jgi:formylglycine-generating enzyme required for sulfatase activity
MSVSEDGTTFTFDQASEELELVEAGDVIVGDASSEAPDGFLRKVSAVSEQDGQVIITTQETTLEETIQDGAIYETEKLAPENIRSTVLQEGVTMLSNPEEANALFEYSLDKVLYDYDGNPDTTNDQIVAKGVVSFETYFDINMKIHWFELESFQFINHSVETASLTIESTLAYEIEKEVEIVKHTFNPITFWVGPVPVVITPVLTVYVGLNGEVHIGISTGVTQSAHVDAGVVYDGAWHPVWYYANDLEFQWPTLSAGLEVKGYAGVSLSFLLYGVAGPKASVEVYLKLVADVFVEPWWSLSAGLEVVVGAEVKVLSFDLGEVEYTVINLEWPIAQANIPPDAPTNPSPPDGVTGWVIHPTLTWEGSDPDGDPVTYDVYFEKDDDSPDVLVAANLTETTYTTGWLDVYSTYYWQIVARDEHGDTRSGDVWSFTTGSGEDCPIELFLDEPVYDAYYGHFTVTGSVTSECSTVTSIIWDWGDWTSDEQWFTATHHYYDEIHLQAYTIIATAYGDVGNSTSMTTTAYRDLQGMEFVAAGEFQMGCDPANDGSYGCAADEGPLHTVYLDAYYIDGWEVRNKAYRQCVRAGVCTPPSSNGSATRPSYFDNPEFGDYPVIYVDWDQANSFCTWLGGRLPTEAEWEKAARGSNDTRVFPWGNDPPNCSLANFNNCVGDTDAMFGYYPGSSPYNLDHMAGNVWEWVSDWFQWDYYNISPGSNPPGPEFGDYKVLRGGGWSDSDYEIRVANRNSNYTSTNETYIGFRCVELP